MRSGLRFPLVRRSWWWVFALFIALPAVALALLGWGAIRADELERRQRLHDQQDQIARLADAALSAAFDRLAGPGAERRGDSESGVNSAGATTAFDVDDRGVVSFGDDKIFIGPFGATPSTIPPRAGPPALADLVGQAQSAEARGRIPEAIAFHERVRAFEPFRAWADVQLLRLRSDTNRAAAALAMGDRALASIDAWSPGGIPLAVVASSFVEEAGPAARERFVPLLEQTLLSLRQGRWWLSLDQRRVYERELMRWLEVAGGSATDSGKDERLSQIERMAALIRSAFDTSHRMPPRVQVPRVPNAVLLVWTRPSTRGDVWSGLVVQEHVAAALFAGAIEPLLEDQPFRAELRDSEGVLWGSAAAHVPRARRVALESVSGWAMAFVDTEPVAAMGTRRVLNYAGVIFPMVLLACGLLMTAWIIRREMALTALQSTFVAAVTHEFKSPITSIRILMERLASGRLPADGSGRYHAAIGAETDRLEGLVNRLLEAQKLQTGQKEYTFRSTIVETLAADAMASLHSQAEAERITLRLIAAPAVPAVEIDRESVSDALRNLIDNAIKYSPPGSEVAVMVDATGSDVRITVDDRGIGVDPADMRRVFEPFYRSRRGDQANVHGTGLGLSLVKATAEAHGGSIAVTSRQGGGSRFTLRLPAGAAPRRSGADQPSLDAAAASLGPDEPRISPSRGA